MKLFMLFLIGSFALGATPRLAKLGRRWQVVLGATVLIAASFYSLRVVG